LKTLQLSGVELNLDFLASLFVVGNVLEGIVMLEPLLTVRFVRKAHYVLDSIPLRFQSPAKHSRELNVDAAGKGKIPRCGRLAHFDCLSSQGKPPVYTFAQLGNSVDGSYQPDDPICTLFPPSHMQFSATSVSLACFFPILRLPTSRHFSSPHSHKFFAYDFTSSPTLQEQSYQ
jgi:hypothetical protein